MGNAIDDTLYNIGQGRKRTTKASLCTVGNGPIKGVKLFSCDGGEGRLTSGRALGEEKQEDNMHYFVCNSRGDI
jgi:hypothetical protein